MRPGRDDFGRDARRRRRRSNDRPVSRDVGLPAPPATTVRDDVIHETVRDELPTRTTAAVDARHVPIPRREFKPVGGSGARRTAGSVRSMLQAPGAARRAVVLHEVLAAPVSLRTDGDDRAW